MNTKQRRKFGIEIEIKDTKGEKRDKTSKKLERKHTKEYAYFRRFSARGGAEQKPKDVQGSNTSYKPDQLQQTDTITHAC